MKPLISDCRFPIADCVLPRILLLLVTGCATGCGSMGAGSTTQPVAATQAAASAATAPASAATESPTIDWAVVSGSLGRKGELRGGVYTVTVPRDDLNVTIEGMDVPAAAGIASEFRFYRCSCGKSVVVGQFVCADYEANDVLLALQRQDILVSNVGPYLLYEKPRLLCIRFQSEGDAVKQAEALKSALYWTARHRDAR